MDKDYIIFQENGLYGAKDQSGIVVIEPQYKEMYPFSCGLSLVRDEKMRFSYVNPQNKPIFPFGIYAWCDNAFCCGFARVIRYNRQNEKRWGIINAFGEIVLPVKYDNIWTLDEDYIHAIKVSVDGNEHTIDVGSLVKGNSLTGLVYIKTYSVEEFKAEFGMKKIVIQAEKETGRMFFPFRTRYGEIAFGNKIPNEELAVSIVLNAQGRLFPLIHLAKDTGVTSLRKSFCETQRNVPCSVRGEKFRWADEEAWDEFEDNNGWSRNDIESGLADAFEGDYENYISR